MRRLSVLFKEQIIALTKACHDQRDVGSKLKIAQSVIEKLMNLTS